MLRILPFILIPVLVVAGLGYWRYLANKPALTTSPATRTEGPIEVPKTLPEASLEDRIKSLEDLVTKLVTQVNSLTSVQSPLPSSDPELNSLNASVTELKARVSALENSTPAPAAAASSSQSTIYIPLGSGGGPWGAADWISLNEYQISLDPANYPSYSGMSLEVTFRLLESAGTGSVRLYNSTDNSATSSQLDTTSTTYELKTTSSFKLATGTKTYKLQVKSSAQKDLFIQSARIKVSF